MGNRILSVFCVAGVVISGTVYWLMTVEPVKDSSNPDSNTSTNIEVAADEKLSLSTKLPNYSHPVEGVGEEFPELASDRYLFSSDPKMAFAKLNNDASNSGSDSQFKLALVLKGCNRFSPRKQSDIDNLNAKALLSSQELSEIEAEYQRCKGLYQEVGDSDLGELSDSWLATAADAGHPIAELMALTTYPDVLSKEEVYPQLVEAFEYLSENPEYQAIMINELMMYFSRYVEPEKMLENNVDLSAGHYRRGVERDAWEFLYCKSSPICDSTEHLSLMQKHFHSYEVDAMLNEAKQYLTALNNSSWDDLKMHP